MVEATRDEAKACADSAPVGMFGIDDVLIGIEVIYYGLKLWQTCASASPAADAVDAASDPVMFRRAQHQVRRSARKNGLNLSNENLNGLTAHMLNHVVKASDETLAACCAEPVIKDESDDV